MATIAPIDKISVKRQPLGKLYPADSPRLFIPDPDMLLVHMESKPEAVADRAGLTPRIFDTWRRTYKDRCPSLLTWLYGGACTTDAMPLITDAMREFRRQAEIARIAVATTGKRKIGDRIWIGSQSRTRSHVQTVMIHYWLRQFRAKYPQQDWLEGWLRRGEDAPAAITVATEEQLKRCAKAWDYLSLATQAEINHPSTAYQLWFTGNPPDLPRTNRLEWLRWLYGSKGYRQAPAFVVTIELQAYRREGSLRAIGKAASESGRTIKEVSTRTARCDRAGLLPSEFDFLMRQADERGVGKDVKTYLNREGEYAHVRYRRRLGLINDKFLVVSTAMAKFHELATAAWIEHRIGAIATLAGFDDWLEDWTTPSRGRDKPAREPQTRGRAASVLLGPTIAATPPATANGSVPQLSDRQRLILDELTAMGATNLEAPARIKDVVKRIDPRADPDNFKHDFADLKKRKLTDSRKGPDGGVWRTDS